ncbi:hypothetical protein [Niveispirillum lacus]|uniref:hypothetical protein n=1 Tax=Niveispirillum lacus TaxID=1981099 RepID=UPI001056C3B3|nr:hypothetical protein [Niveispirillum lacus]
MIAWSKKRAISKFLGLSLYVISMSAIAGLFIIDCPLNLCLGHKIKYFIYGASFLCLILGIYIHLNYSTVKINDILEYSSSIFGYVDIHYRFGAYGIPCKEVSHGVATAQVKQIIGTVDDLILHISSGEIDRNLKIRVHSQLSTHRRMTKYGFKPVRVHVIRVCLCVISTFVLTVFVCLFFKRKAPQFPKNWKYEWVATAHTITNRTSHRVP